MAWRYHILAIEASLGCFFAGCFLLGSGLANRGFFSGFALFTLLLGARHFLELDLDSLLDALLLSKSHPLKLLEARLCVFPSLLQEAESIVELFIDLLLGLIDAFHKKVVLLLNVFEVLFGGLFQSFIGA